jgi:hypothetical protein
MDFTHDLTVNGEHDGETSTSDQHHVLVLAAAALRLGLLQ